MQVLFTHSYFYKFDEKQWRFKQPYPPLATILAAAVVRNAGYKVSLFDTNLRDDTTDLLPVLVDQKPKYLVIYDDGFNYLSKMCLTNMRNAAFKMAEESKKRGCTVIVSSSDAADHYEKYFNHHVDYVVRGEGEETLVALLTALENSQDIEQVQGLAYRRAGEIKLTAPRQVIRDLDTLPMPAWDLVDMEAYRKIWLQHHGYFSLNIATTRGCPFKCNWCAKPIYGNRYTSRSPQHVVNEIEMLIKNYAPDYFWMCDDIFGLKPGWVQEFKMLLEEKHIKIRYKIQSRVDLLLQEDTLDALSESGVDTIWVGAESGSQKILDAMDKGTKVEEIYEATRLMKKKGIRVAFFLQFGYLGETQEDINATIQMVRTLMPDEVGISVSYPLPGTKFYEKVKDQMREKQNWSDSDDLMVMFESTFNKQYYKELHRYVHGIYRKEKGFLSLKKLIRDPLRLTYKDLRAGLATFYYIPTTFTQGLKLRKLKLEGPAVNP
ncbi:radical SAM protein [Chryseolinea sp. H1M3-3]|uniref:B12-binding domain-containing radical SAM protein n=1 Tax=Chryseolinea sp. H1M3-3 TaxID=3034144 RepID=UPI0023ECC9A9|nr:radical SAM protein [Chryseolinea sp. H1M3-3]